MADSLLCSITTLRDLAMELDEGLGEHVEEFARELHIESFDGGEEGGGRSPGNSSKFDECEGDEDDEDDDLLLGDEECDEEGAGEEEENAVSSTRT